MHSRISYCTYCGKELGWRVHKCPHCGHLVAADTIRTDLPTVRPNRPYEPHSDRKSRSNRSKSVFYGVLWVIVAFVGILLLGYAIESIENVINSDTEAGYTIDIFRSDKDQINEMAKPTLQKILNEEFPAAGIEVLETSVVKKDRSSNEYDGIALIRINGDEIYIGFNVIFDGEDAIISVPPEEVLRLRFF